MPKIFKIKVYTFDELSEKAKQKAMEFGRNNMIVSNIEKLEKILADYLALVFGLPNINVSTNSIYYFDGKPSEDAVVFWGKANPAWLIQCDRCPELHEPLKRLYELEQNFSLSIKRSGLHSMNVLVDLEGYPQIKEYKEALEQCVEERFSGEQTEILQICTRIDKEVAELAEKIKILLSEYVQDISKKLGRVACDEIEKNTPDSEIILMMNEMQFMFTKSGRNFVALRKKSGI